MVVALDNNSSLTRWLSLNSSIACSFSVLSGEVSNISNARFIIALLSTAVRHTWYCSGKCSVTYSLIDSLALLSRYCREAEISRYEAFVTKHTYSNYLHVIEMSTTSTSTKDVKCELCGMTFVTHQEKEEHKKLEHKEHREPSGVS